MAKSLSFYLFLPQAGMSYEMIRERARLLESLGYDGLWLVDHMFAKGLPDVDFLEGWTALSGLAEASDKLRLGVMVTCNSYRNPGLLAKMAATADHISGGRLELGIGAGWMEEEYVAYGYDFPSVGTRLAQLGESLEIITRLCSSDRTSYDGRYYRFTEAPFAPKPVQDPLPVTIGGAGEKVLLRLVARYASRWNCPMTSAHDLERLCGVLKGHCHDLERNFDDITISEQTAVVIGRDSDDLAAKMGIAKMMIGGWVDIKRMAVVGTPEDVVRGLQAKLDAGVTDFALVFGDMGMPDTLQLFSEQVVPKLSTG